MKKEWIESKAAAEEKLAQEKENIFRACYEKNGKELDAAITGYKAAARAVSGWQVWIDASEEDRFKLAQGKARARAVKFSEKIGKSPADILQFAEDAAQEAIMFIYYDMEKASERCPESILSFIAGKYISSYYYRSAGRNGREEDIDGRENIDAYLYSKNVFGPGPESSLLALDHEEEIIGELKSKYRNEARIIIKALKAGYNQSEIASLLGTSQQVINYRLQTIKAAARIVEANDAESSSLLRLIGSDEKTIANYNKRIGK